MNKLEIEGFPVCRLTKLNLNESNSKTIYILGIQVIGRFEDYHFRVVLNYWNRKTEIKAGRIIEPTSQWTTWQQAATVFQF